MRGLYVHFPFCVKKCNYCDFYSVPGETYLFDHYIRAVLAEADKYKGMVFDTVFIGGGTPSLMGSLYLGGLMEGLYARFGLGKLVESTIEANPESTSPDFLRTAISLGLNRISIGVQSLNDEELRRSGRIHNAWQALRAVNNALDSGFSNVSADIIVGLPGQSQSSLFKTISDLCSLGLTHMSAYCLSIEKNTAFYLSPPSDLPDDESQSSLFEFVVDGLEKRGYTHYEISNFSLPGSQCQHNLNYWRGGEYVGLGPSAASHINGIRRTNASDLGAYLRNPLTVEAEEDILDLHHKMSEEAILRLRLLDEGLDLDELFYHCVYDADIKERLDALVDRRMLIRTGNKYWLPSERVLTSNQVFMHVLN